MESIKDKIERFYNLFSNYNIEGGQNTRYKSWEWCHDAFLKYKKTYNKSNNEVEKNEIVEFLSLHLAFYLASWGMYRGSSFLLQRDYKAHKKAVTYVLEKQYDVLWNYAPNETNIENAKHLIFDKDKGIYWRIKKSYEPDIATETLTTKILMGTFGCVPAFDRFLKEGISTYISLNGDVIDGSTLNKTIEDKRYDTFVALAKLAIKNKHDFTVSSTFIYPPMKCVDMYLWEIGYELDIANGLISTSNAVAKKNELLQIAASLGLCDASLSFEDACRIIKEKNGSTQH